MQKVNVLSENVDQTRWSRSVLPAHAGVILAAKKLTYDLQGAPRACGGDPKRELTEDEAAECSPRMRG